MAPGGIDPDNITTRSNPRASVCAEERVFALEKHLERLVRLKVKLNPSKRLGVNTSSKSVHFKADHFIKLRQYCMTAMSIVCPFSVQPSLATTTAPMVLFS